MTSRRKPDSNVVVRSLEEERHNILELSAGTSAERRPVPRQVKQGAGAAVAEAGQAPPPRRCRLSLPRASTRTRSWPGSATAAASSPLSSTSRSAGARGRSTPPACWGRGPRLENAPHSRRRDPWANSRERGWFIWFCFGWRRSTTSGTLSVFARRSAPAGLRPHGKSPCDAGGAMPSARFWAWLGCLFRCVFCISVLSFVCPYCIMFGALVSSVGLNLTPKSPLQSGEGTLMRGGVYHLRCAVCVGRWSE